MRLLLKSSGEHKKRPVQRLYTRLQAKFKDISRTFPGKLNLTTFHNIIIFTEYNVHINALINKASSI